MENMNKSSILRIALVATLAALVLACSVAFAQSVQIQGVINARRGATMTVQSQDSGNVVVLLTDNTQVEDVQGIFHARKKQMGLTALEPGLQVKVKGSYNAQNQLVADTVQFNGKELQTATDIQAGVTPVQQQEQVQQEKIAEQQAQLKQQGQALTKEQQEQAAQAAKIAANKAAIEAANKRFGELADYNILGEVTVLFGNGEVNVESQYDPKLQQLAQQAKGTDAYIIQVKGYASAVGSAALNQRLSQERAANVTTYLEEKCGIPLTNILAPGAMGTSKQVAPDNTVEGQAENRRVVVRILQNKGISGT